MSVWEAVVGTHQRQQKRKKPVSRKMGEGHRSSDDADAMVIAPIAASERIDRGPLVISERRERKTN
jgi:hypothetical protein